MEKMSCSRVFLGGLLAGVVIIVLGFAAYAMYLEELYVPAMEALGHPIQESVGFYVFSIVMSFVAGIFAIWLYAAIRPRYGAGAKTAVIAGVAFWILGGLFPAISIGFTGLFPANVLFVDGITSLVICVVATFLGAWVYKE